MSEPLMSPPAVALSALPRQLVLFDGECGLCDHSVHWVIDHDTSAKICFAPLQGETAAALRAAYPVIPTDIETMVYVEDAGEPGARVSLRSRAVLRVCAAMPSPWRWLAAFAWLPRALTDGPYRLVARLRHRLWGRTQACRLPSPEERRRFLA